MKQYQSPKAGTGDYAIYRAVGGASKPLGFSLVASGLSRNSANRSAEGMRMRKQDGEYFAVYSGSRLLSMA